MRIEKMIVNFDERNPTSILINFGSQKCLRFDFAQFYPIFCGLHSKLVKIASLKLKIASEKDDLNLSAKYCSIRVHEN